MGSLQWDSWVTLYGRRHWSELQSLHSSPTETQSADCRRPAERQRPLICDSSAGLESMCKCFVVITSFSVLYESWKGKSTVLIMWHCQVHWFNCDITNSFLHIRNYSWNSQESFLLSSLLPLLEISWNQADFKRLRQLHQSANVTSALCLLC